MNPFDAYENNTADDGRAIPTSNGLIPGQRLPSDPIEKFPRQPKPEER